MMMMMMTVGNGGHKTSITDPGKQNRSKVHSFIDTWREGRWAVAEMPTYQKGLCSEPCIVGRLGGLLIVPNLNTDMTGWFGRVRRSHSKSVYRVVTAMFECSRQWTIHTNCVTNCTAKLLHREETQITQDKSLQQLKKPCREAKPI